MLLTDSDYPHYYHGDAADPQRERRGLLYRVLWPNARPEYLSQIGAWFNSVCHSECILAVTTQRLTAVTTEWATLFERAYPGVNLAAALDPSTKHVSEVLAEYITS